MIKKNLKRFTFLLGLAVLVSATIPSGMVKATTVIAINSCQNLQKIGNASGFPLDGNYVLAGDINCLADTSLGGALYNSGAGFAPIAYGTSFTGSIDGQGFTIKGLKINRSGTDNVGLISESDNATIKNIKMVGGSIVGRQHVGSYAGIENGLTMENVFSDVHVTGDGYVSGIIGFNKWNGGVTTHLTRVRYSGAVSATEFSVAGLIGDNDGDAVITQSASTANISSSGVDVAYIGGLVGDTDGALTISKSFSTGNINAPDGDSVGGLVGWSDNDTISDSFATGSVTGHVNVGGLLGYINEGTVTNSYSSGAVVGDSAVGGFIGAQDSLIITHSFYGLDSSGQLAACGNIGGCDPSGIDDLTTAEIINPNTFRGAGWNYDDTWNQKPSSNFKYPFLIWPLDATTTNSVSGNDAELSVSFGCFINNMDVAAASTNTSSDADFSYPEGMMNFSIGCGSPGFTTQITQYFYGANPDQAFVVRKYNPTTKTYSDVPGATISFVTINGKSAAKVVYSIKDGGSLDADGKANGTIEDPSGLGVNTTPGLPNTGFNPN